MTTQRSTEEPIHIARQSTPNSDDSNDIRVKSDRRSPPSTPRWVKISAIVVIILILIFGIMHLTGNSLGNHMPSMDHSGQQP